MSHSKKGKRIVFILFYLLICYLIPKIYFKKNWFGVVVQLDFYFFSFILFFFILLIVIIIIIIVITIIFFLILLLCIIFCVVDSFHLDFIVCY